MTDNQPIDLEGTICDIKYIGEILSNIDIGQSIDPNVIAGIGWLISRTAGKAIEALPQGGAS